MKTRAILFLTVIAVLGITANSVFAYSYRVCLEEKLKWDSNSVQMRASGVSFPAGGWRTALADAVSAINNNPSNFRFNLTYDEPSVGMGNGENETWFSSDSSILDGAPAITYTWSECIDYWIFGKTVKLTEADVIFDVNESYTTSTAKTNLLNYGGSGRPLRTTAIHELGHALGLGHVNSIYNIMGQDWTHIHVNGSDSHAYFGEDASNGAVFLYDANSSNLEDVGVVHWRWIGSSGEYSTHGRTRIFTSGGAEESKFTDHGEPRYWVSVGETIQVEFTYENNGSSRQANTQVGYYLSTNDTISTYDQRLGGVTMDLGRNTPYTAKTTLTIPNNLTSNGDYYIGAIVDENDAIHEVNESNNATYIGIRVRPYTPTPTPTPTSTPTPRIIINPTFIILPTFFPILNTPTPTPTPRRLVFPTLPIFEIALGRVTVTDNLKTKEDISNGTDIDPADNRELVVRWNLDAQNVNVVDYHIYVDVDNSNKKTFLGRVGSGDLNFFVWQKGNRFLTPAFAEGPQSNHSYQFYVYVIRGAKGNLGPFTHAGPVSFLVGEEKSKLSFAPWVKSDEGWGTYLQVQPSRLDSRVQLKYDLGGSEFLNEFIVCEEEAIPIFVKFDSAQPVVVTAKLLVRTPDGNWIDFPGSELSTIPSEVIQPTSTPTVPPAGVPAGEVIVTDSINTFDDLSNSEDVDLITDRELTIQWNLNFPRATDFHVYVSVDGSKDQQFLGLAGSGQATAFRWREGLRTVAPGFRTGPQDGHSYQFYLYVLGTTLTSARVGILGTFPLAGPVKFTVISTLYSPTPKRTISVPTPTFQLRPTATFQLRPTSTIPLRPTPDMRPTVEVKPTDVKPTVFVKPTDTILPTRFPLLTPTPTFQGKPTVSVPSMTPTPTRTPRIKRPISALYIYGDSPDTSTPFVTFLNLQFISTQSVHHSGLVGMDLSRYDVLIVGNDTVNALGWGTPAEVNAIISSGKPILGIGEGGYALFGNMQLPIGNPNGWHFNASSVLVLNYENPTYPVYQNPNFISTNEGNTLPLYLSPVADAEIYLPTIPSRIIAFGRSPNDADHYPLVLDSGQYFLWGFVEGPTQMTDQGLNLFENAVRVLVQNEVPVISTPIPTATLVPIPTATASVPGTNYDLYVDQFSGPATAAAGQAIGVQLSLSVGNKGPSDAVSFSIGIYLSSDSNSDSTDRLLVGGREFVPSLSANSTTMVSLASVMSIPTDYPAGPAYLIALIEFADGSPSNNSMAIPIQITAGIPNPTATPLPQITPTPAETVRALLIYGNDTNAAQKFTDFLNQRSIISTMIQTSSLPNADLSQYDLLIVAEDTGNTLTNEWGTPEALAAIQKSSLPILGLGEGGYYLFGKMLLLIGYPFGWHGLGNNFSVADSTHSIFNQPNALAFKNDQLVQVNQATASAVVEIYITPGTTFQNLTLLGRSTTEPNHYSLLMDRNRYFLWGFSGDPSQMTDVGLNAFENVVRFLKGK